MEVSRPRIRDGKEFKLNRPVQIKFSASVILTVSSSAVRIYMDNNYFLYVLVHVSLSPDS